MPLSMGKVLGGGSSINVMVEVKHGGQDKTIGAGHEVILSTGAVMTPKLLMQSGIGGAAQLAKHGIKVVRDLPGVGQNFQDHVMVASCI